jgi:hypothetical protein
MPYSGFTITGGQCLFSLQHRPRSGHAVRSIGCDIIRPLEQWEYQDRLHRSRPCVRELEAALDREPLPAGRTETAPSLRGMRESHPQHATEFLKARSRVHDVAVEDDGVLDVTDLAYDHRSEMPTSANPGYGSKLTLNWLVSSDSSSRIAMKHRSGRQSTVPLRSGHVTITSSPT